MLRNLTSCRFLMCDFLFTALFFRVITNFEKIKEFKFGVIGNLRQSRTLQWKIFWKKRKLKKNADKNFELFT